MSITYNFQGKTAVITGAAKGIGKAIAKKFAESGANVVIADMDEVVGKATAEELNKTKGKAIFIKVDITNEQNVVNLREIVLEKFSTIDILVNNAGVAPESLGPPMAKTDLHDWKRVFEVNLLGMVNVSKSFYGVFYKNKAGKIVNIASIAAYMPSVVIPQYAASKAAAINFTNTLAQEMGAFNVNVNCVNPGYIFTNIYYENGLKIKEAVPHLFADCETSEEVVKKMATDSALHRTQEPEDIANAVLFLASDEAKNITGQSLNVDSGKIFK